MPALSPQTVAAVKASAPALAVHGRSIVQAMYRRLFEHAEVKALFNQANQGEGGGQVDALAGAVLAYARHIDDLAPLLPTVERIAQKHVGFGIEPRHYGFVADALIGAIGEVLGEAATPALIEAWGEAYWFLADILKDREAAIRAELQGRAGGWSGWRAFVVTGKTAEAALITSFVLRPADGGPVVRHRPGQYLTLRFGGGAEMRRNYSISSAPNGDRYRITVKREDDGKGGSRFLHRQIEVGDTLEATAPAGDFFLPDTQARPVVLLSGGVGLTPMVSMVEAIAAGRPDLEAHFVHGALSSATHAMGPHVKALADRHGAIRVTSFYSEPLESDAPGRTHDVTGLVTTDWLRENTPLAEADVFLCGPRPFLRHFVGELVRAGVPRDRVHYEFFGPADEAL